MKIIMENFRKYIKESDSALPAGFEEFGFGDDEVRDDIKPNPPQYEDLIALDRGDKFTIGNRKPVYRVIGAPSESGAVGSQIKTVVIDGTAERKYYILRPVGEDYEVAAFEAIGGTTDHVDKPRGKPGFVSNIVKGEQQ